MDFMPLRLNSSGLIYSICILAAIILYLVAMECQKLDMVDSPIPPLSFHGFEGKQKNLYVQFFKMSHFKYNCSNPPGESVLLKLCQNVSDR